MLAVQVKASILMLISALPSLQQPTKAFIPTSMAIEVAQKVAIDQGYPIYNNKLYYFDLLTSRDGKPFLPGFVTVGFYGNDNPLNTISIDENTGQVVDSVACIIFEYPDLRTFQEKLRRATGARAKAEKELMSEIGCEPFRVLKKAVRGRHPNQ